ncbi:MAG: hypothetical protein ACYTFO_04975 [Planctomycetota bacterium]|jgi:ABC-type uncharacterized transport system permease subunit
MMEMVLTVAEWVLPLLYLVLVIDYGVTFFQRVRAHTHNLWIPVIIILHAAFLTARGIHFNRPPLFNGYEVLSVISLSTTIVYYIVERVSRDRRTGVFVFLVVFLLQYTSSVFLTEANVASSGGGARLGWLSAHTIAATLAYTAMALAGVHGALHLIGRRNLKRHNVGLLFDRLPPLQSLGRVSWYAIVGGLVFMTIAVATGSRMRGGGSMSPKIVVKIVMGSVTWVVCATAVLGKGLGKWSDSRIAWIATGGFLAVAGLFIASLALS